MPQATAHKASHRKPKQALQLLALEQELEDPRTSDPHSKMNFKNVLLSHARSLMTHGFAVQAISEYQLQNLTFNLIKTVVHSDTKHNSVSFAQGTIPLI